ncbi:MAG: adenine nucleotide alpha hydrolase [Nitrospira sp.]|nr:adenine nucleotide alpha hydrolase [Nitrospira sp.]
MTVRRVWLAWSSGKDCAWALHVLRQQPDVEVIGLLTTLNEAADRVAMHAVRRTLLEAQASAVGLPLRLVYLPWPCSNEEYERRMSEVIAQAREAGVTHMAFGDLMLEDIRAYRIRQLSGTGIEPLFPLWKPSGGTAALAKQMIQGGVKAVLTCVDPKQLSESFIGWSYDDLLLSELPAAVDPCGEHGEFHTFCFDGPMFTHAIPIQVGEIVMRDGFCFADVIQALPTETS